MRKGILCTLGVMIAVFSLVFAGCSTPSPSSPSANDSTPVIATTTVQANTQTTTAAVTNSVSSNSTVPVAVSNINNAGNTGVLQIRVTDAPAKEDITAIDVSVKTIQIKEVGPGDINSEANEEGTLEDDKEANDNSGWTIITLKADNHGNYPTFNLFEVKDNPETLAHVGVPVGNYKVRLEVASVMITFGEKDPVTAIVPSGKIKFNQSFVITGEETTDLLFDFDAAKSVHVTGNGKVMFKPVIKLTVDKVKNTDVDDNGDEDSANKNEVQITTRARLADGEVGAEYEKQLEAKGGEGDYKWSSADLPEWIALDKNEGIISGTPDSADNYTFTIKVEDAGGISDNKTFKLEILEAGTLKIFTDDLPDGQVGVVYEADEDGFKLKAENGNKPYTWEANGLPEGLELNENSGVIIGTPAAGTQGDYNIEIIVTDEDDKTAKVTLTLKIEAAED
jgi:hypothetical protein